MADTSEISDGERLQPVTVELWFPKGPSLNVKVRRVSGLELLSGPYEFEVEFSLEAGAIDLEQLLGVDCELVLDRNGLGRHVYGVVSRVEFALDADTDAIVDDEGARVVITPAFALLEQEVDTRFFGGVSVIEILDDLLAGGLRDYGRELDVMSHIVGAYPRRDYCVQFRESTLAFCERIMQEEGIGYFFQADLEGERERMVLFDNNEDCAQVELLVPEPIPIVRESPDELDRESLQQLDWLARRVPNRVLARAYNLKDPAQPEQAAAQREAKILRQVVLEGERRHIIDDPIDDPSGRSFDGSGLEQSQRAASLAFERFNIQAGTGHGRGNAIGFSPGALFEVGEGAQDTRRGDTLLLTSVKHEAIRDEGPGALGFGYQNLFACTPSAQPFRPPRSRPRPSVQGVLTGVVVGPENEEIHTDALGRVRVRFHTDRHAKDLEPSSCWVRVAQIWAGRGYGAMVIPRVGMEVVVSFVDGNPDCPIVTGCVYNGAHEPPYSLPGELTKTSFKSQSSPGGDGFNEIRLEDTKGAEQIFVHGQRRMDLRVRGSLLESAGGNREEVVGGGQGEDAKGDHNTLVHGDVNHHVMGAAYVKVDGPRHTCVAQDVVEDFAAKHFVIAGELSQLSAPNIIMEASEQIGLNADELEFAASSTLSLKGYRKLVLESYEALELKVGGSFIALSPFAVSIGGDLVRLNSGGSAGEAKDGLVGQSAELSEPWDALPADDGNPARKHGGGRGGGGRTRTSRTLEPHHAPEPPMPEPPYYGPDYSLQHGKGTLERLTWLDQEVWCGEQAKLALEVEQASPGARAGLWILDAIDGSAIFEGIGVELRDGTHPTEICDILPREVGGRLEQARLLLGSMQGSRTPSPLRLRFMNELPPSTHRVDEHSFQVSVSGSTVKICGKITYVRGWMYYIINVSNCVPFTTLGRIGGSCYGSKDWWYCKPVGPEEYVFWDGSEWLPVPKTWTDPNGVKRHGVAVWREPDNTFSTQFGDRAWPDPLPKRRPEADVRAVLKTWEQTVKTMWSGQYTLKRVGCGSGFLPECCRLEVEFDVDFVEANFRRNDSTIIISDNFARANVHAWPLNCKPRTAAHEFGHMLGNPDEYAGALSVDPSVNGDGATNGIDSKSIMNDQSTVRLRHYKPVCDLLSKAIEQQLGKQVTYKAE